MNNIHFDRELAAVNAPEWVYPIIADMFGEYSGQGHSGGSHGLMISSMESWLTNLDPITDKSSLLAPLSKILFRLGIHEDRVLVLGYFIKLANYECLSPLTGEEDEWIYQDYDKTVAQNKRMGAVFKNLDTNEVRWLDGRTFCNLTSDNSSWVGWGSYYSSTPVEFPWTKPPVEYHYFIDSHREVGLPSITDPEGYQKAHFVKMCAGYIADPYISPKSFFIKPEDKLELILSFNLLVKETKDFTYPNKVALLKELNALTWSEEEDATPDLMLELRGGYTGTWVAKRLVYPLMRLVASIPESVVKDEAGELCGHRNSKWVPEFQAPHCPTRHFQDWQPMVGQYAGYVAVRLTQLASNGKQLSRISKAGEVNKAYFDRVGYEIRYLADNDDYLYSMRRRFNIKHPKPKAKLRRDNAIASDPETPSPESN